VCRGLQFQLTVSVHHWARKPLCTQSTPVLLLEGVFKVYFKLDLKFVSTTMLTMFTGFQDAACFFSSSLSSCSYHPMNPRTYGTAFLVHYLPTASCEKSFAAVESFKRQILHSVLLKPRLRSCPDLAPSCTSAKFCWKCRVGRRILKSRNTNGHPQSTPGHSLRHRRSRPHQHITSHALDWVESPEGIADTKRSIGVEMKKLQERTEGGNVCASLRRLK